MGFTRRFSSYPSSAELTAIEGVNIIDVTPPGGVQGVGTGVAAVVGEFADMTHAVTMDSSGNFSTAVRPQEVTSAQDLINKFGGWDEYLGEFGGDCGNGFAELQGKGFARLICAPVNIASTKGARIFRQLPTNQSAAVALPIVPMQGGVVAAGREFKIGADRFRIAKRVPFTGDVHYLNGVDGSVTVAAPAVTSVFTTNAGTDLTAAGVAVGDILVMGVIGLTGDQGDNAGCFRVKALAPGGDATKVTVEALTGAAFAWGATSVVMAFRFHPAATADSGGELALSAVNGFNVPVRCLDNSAAASAVLAPTVAPTTPSATVWDTLSGLGGIAAAAGITRLPNVQAVNAVNHADFAAAYGSAIDALLTDESPINAISIVWSARKYTSIQTLLKANAIAASANGKGRFVCLSPVLDGVESVTAATASTSPGVGGNRLDRLGYAWPGVRSQVAAAIGSTVTLGDGSTTDDGIIDSTFDSWLASVLSQLAPERNPGQAAPPATTALANVLGLASNAPALSMNDYILLRQAGVVAPRIDATVGPMIQSGITTSLISGEKNISRRRMTDFLEDSIAARLIQFSKLPLTIGLKDAMYGEIVAFMDTLRSEGNPAAQRINEYSVDDKSGNTLTTEAAGIWIIIVRCRLLATADFITLQVEAGEGVVVAAV